MVTCSFGYERFVVRSRVSFGLKDGVLYPKDWTLRNTLMLVSDEEGAIKKTTSMLGTRIRTMAHNDPLHRIHNNLKDGLVQSGLWGLVAVLLMVINSTVGFICT
eukprot:947400-Karenia_brevis.AAC.1